MNVSRGTEEKLKKYVDLLLKWNKTINLISSNSVDHIWSRHINDAVQLMKYIKELDTQVVDIGAGAGLPGVVLSILGVKKVTLVESDERKCAFLRQVSKVSSGEILILNDRVEKLDNIGCDIITARGFAGVASILELTKKIEVRDRYILLKGKSFEEEIVEARKDWLFDCVVHDSITDRDGKVLEIYNIQKLCQQQ